MNDNLWLKRLEWHLKWKEIYNIPYSNVRFFGTTWVRTNDGLKHVFE